MSGRRSYDLDAIRRALPLTDLIGRDVAWDRRKTRAAAGDFWAPCPFHVEKSPSFHVVDRADREFYYCFGCHQKGGSIFDYVMARDGVDFGEALKRCAVLAGIEPEVVPDADAARRDVARKEERERSMARMESEQREAQERGVKRARSIWRNSAPDPAVATYLSARGINLDAMGGVPASLRFGLNWQSKPRPNAPSMVAPIQDVMGRVIAAHCTYLAPDHRSKIHADPNKRIFGPYWGGMIRLGPVAPVIGMAEGIETALAVMQMERQQGRNITCWAAGTLGNLAGHPEKTPEGAVFPREVRHVRIYADNDTKSRDTLSNALDFASLRLRQTGVRVDVIMPPRGMDFLDFQLATAGVQ